MGGTDKMAANRHDWEREEFRRLTKIPFKDEYNRDELGRLKEGLVPEAMEDKWFIYFHNNCLYFHRSWTGQGVYQVALKVRRNGTAVVKWAKASKDVIVIDKRYEAAILEFLIANLLLGYDIPFPKHEKIQDEQPGVFQHVISATGYKETTVDKKSLKRTFK